TARSLIDVAAGQGEIHQSQTLRGSGRDTAAGEHQVQGVYGTDAAHRPQRAAKTGMDAEAHFGQSEPSGRFILGEAITAGESQFQSAPQAIAVNPGDRGAGQALE